jgi:hypothetical protein
MLGLASVKLPVLSLTLVFAVHTARIRALLVDEPATVQLKLPPVALEFWTEGAIVVHVLPPFVLRSSRTAAVDPRLFVHVIV